MSVYYSQDLEQTLDVIGNKWTLPIVLSLLDGPKRFNELQKSTCCCPRTLSARLTELEASRLVKRKTFKDLPLKVEYSLTPKGKSLDSVIVAMASWGKAN